MQTSRPISLASLSGLPRKDLIALAIAKSRGLLPALTGSSTAAPLAWRDWLETVSPKPTWDWAAPHLQRAESALDRVTSGETRRLMISIPVRHGKSELATIRYPVWRLERDPALRVCIGCYNQSFAERFGRRTRRLARERFPISEERSAAKEWETSAGGMLHCCGVGSPPTGLGFNLIVIDDPVKSREEAESEAYRERVWDWYTSDLWTRQEPGCGIVLIMSRWHHDDLAGRLLQTADGREPWMLLHLPALCEEPDAPGEWRQEGEPLWPQRFDREALDAARGVLGEYGFAGLYQQRPTPREGGMFHRAWFETVNAIPAGASWVRYWDKAATAGGSGARTAGVLMARAGGAYYVASVIAGRWNSDERERVILATAQSDNAERGNVRVWVEQEPGSGGKESAEATIKRLAGFSCHAERVTGDKVTRAEPLAAQASVGNVKILAGSWNEAFLSEAEMFPEGALKDQIDAAGGAFNKLALGVVVLPRGRAGTGRRAAGGISKSG